LTRESLGVYSLSLTVTTEGRWDWRALSTGTPQAIGEGVFHVLDSVFVP
jgi:hypothetical protein